MYINKVTLIGNLTRDVELKALPSGTKVANLSVATNRYWKDAQGNKQEDVEFHNVIAFGKQAEVIAQYFKKGNQILVEGRIQTRSWDATDGSKKYRTEIVLEGFQFGNKSKEATGVTETPKAKSLDDIPTNAELEQDEIDMSSIPF